MGFFTPKNTKKKVLNGGFTLVEVIVAVGLFVAVFIAISGSFLSIIGAYKKVMAERTNVDNLSTAIESMVRGIKTGTTYHCGSGGVGIGLPQDCAITGDTYLAFEKAQGNITSAADQVVYRFSGGVLEKSDDSGTSFYPVTENTNTIRVTDFRFYVRGAASHLTPSGDINPPKVIIVIKGTSGLDPTKASTFSVQTAIIQRVPDID